MIFVLGIDAATWSIIRPNLDVLPAFKKLCQTGKCRTLIITEKAVSPAVWCSMFSGKRLAEHGHDSYVVGGNIVKREHIKTDFIWDVAQREGKVARALNVPFVVPPYSFGVSFKPVGFGLPTNEKEWGEELERVTTTTRRLIEERPNVLISVYTSLDRIQHFHWGEPLVLDWYQRLDSKIGQLIFDTGFLEEDHNKLIVISDHGFCSFGQAKIQTLPLKTEHGDLKGDHHEEAVLITMNLEEEIAMPQDVFFVLRKELGVA